MLRVQSCRTLIVRTFRDLLVLMRIAPGAANILCLFVDLDTPALAAGILCDPDEAHYFFLHHCVCFNGGVEWFR
jgi:hypothetical protein